MTEGTCVRCGNAGLVAYGSDGLPYCTNCSFYGMNKQCSRCRMYLPASELQQYRGQMTCPYCVQDLRDEDRKSEEYHEERPHLDVLQYPEQCERCGRDLKGRVYIWNGKKLCKKCVEDEQAKWGIVGGGPMGAPYKVSLEPEKRRKEKGVIEAIISESLHLLGIRKKPQKLEVIIVKDKMPIDRAKPMNEEGLMKKKKQEVKPAAEGLMKTKNEEFFESVPSKKENPPPKPKKEKPAPKEEMPKEEKKTKRRKKKDPLDVFLAKENNKKP